MIDRIFSAALTLGLLIAATLAIGSELLGLNHRAAPAARAEVMQLPRVEITGPRVPAVRDVAKTERNEPAQQRVQ